MASTVEMAALDGQHQVAAGADVGGHEMHVDTEPARQHAARIAHAAGVVEGKADRQRMQHDAALAGRLPVPAASTREMSLSVTLPWMSTSAASSSLAIRPAEIENDGIDLALGAALGEVDSVAHRLLGLGEIDHGAGLHAARIRCG